MVGAPGRRLQISQQGIDPLENRKAEALAVTLNVLVDENRDEVSTYAL